MKKLILIFFTALLGLLHAAPAPINPATVALLYNSSIPESEALATTYAEQRRIPAANVIGLPLPVEPDITRAQYEAEIVAPLSKIFTDKKWWELGQDNAGITLPIKNQIRVLVTFKGVPLRINRREAIAGDEKAGQFAANNEAAVDSELALFGVQNYPQAGPIPNPYYKKDLPFSSSQLKPFIIVGRLDGPTYTICTRMLMDSLDIEEQGLWGRSYIDFAKKGAGYELGDDWLENIVALNQKSGIPTVIDRNIDTFVNHYPMTDAALYFGWYAHNVDGPLLDPAFQFKKGAVAVHLHSFSAMQLTNANANWSAPILAHGAAATLGNVFEPYLQLTHNFDIFHERLLQGYTLVEAAHMAIPFLSWQGVVLGDPLYRPYAQFSKIDPTKNTAERDYHTLRAAALSWPKLDERLPKLEAAAKKLNSGNLHEAVGLLYASQNKAPQAAEAFSMAENTFTDSADKLRQVINRVEIARQAQNIPLALQTLAEGEKKYATSPKAPALQSLRVILDPPPPPPAQ